MAITDGLIVRVQPVAGDAAIKNLVNNELFTGIGTPLLVDEGSEKAWQITDGTTLSIAVNASMQNVTGGGKTIVMRVKFTNFGTLADQVFAGLRTNSAVSVAASEGPRFYRSSSTSRVYARSGTLMNTGTTTITWLNNIVTIVYVPKITAADSNDVGHQWWSRSDRVGTAADATSTSSTWVSRSFTDFFISASSGAQFNLLDFLVYDRQLTDQEASDLTTGANGLRMQIPAPGGTAPAGTVTIGTITPNSTGASAPFTYSAADQTGFEYRIDGGTAVTGTTSPQVVTGLSPSTAYTIEIRATNASGAGSWSTPANFTTSGVAVSFVGGPIPDQVATVGVPFSLNVAAYFTGTLTPLAYDFSFGNVTGTGLALNASTGMMEGTPTATGNPDLQFRATDTGANTAVSNLIALTINPAGDVTAPVFTVAPAVTSITQTGGTATATIDETGSIFYVIVLQAEATPSVAQVIAGQNAAGGAPIDNGSAVGTTTLSDPFTGLTSGQSYKACFAARDDELTPNTQAAVTVVNFAAAAAPVGTITSQPLTRNTGVITGVVSLDFVDLTNPSTGALVVRKTGLSTNASSIFTFTDAAAVTGTTYRIDWRESTGEFGSAYVVAS